jgi:DNA-directed RNA polymerase specialized sigma24 family protein
MSLRDNQVLDRMLVTARPCLEDAHATLLSRATMLLDEDQMLLELALKNRLTHRQLARLMHVPSGTICRRIRRLTNRLCDPMIVALLDANCPLPPEHRQLAVEHMLHRRSAPELADRHRIPVGQVRRMLEYVRGWHRGTVSAPRRTRW